MVCLFLFFLYIMNIIMTNQMDLSAYQIGEKISSDFLDKAILIVGPKECGKTLLIKDIYSKIQNQIDEIHIFCDQDRISEYQDITNAFYDTDIENIDLIQYSINNVQKNKLFILDDIYLSKKNVKSNLLREIIFNGRHYHITFILSNQIVPLFPPELRCNLDYIFLTKHLNYPERQKLFCYFFGFLSSMKEFEDKLNELSFYEFMCLKNYKTALIKYNSKNQENLLFKNTTKIGIKKNLEITKEKLNKLIKELELIRDQLFQQ
jgi:hypothetical protein